MCVFSPTPTLFGCYVEVSNVIIHFASNFLLFDLPDQISSWKGFCTVDLFAPLFGKQYHGPLSRVCAD